MDFLCLSRRELQALCKKNKIPANLTNVAMADALKALEIVEGIEEYLKPMESETSQSSTESPVKSDETSPCMLHTVSRSTRRRNVVREEPKTFPSRTTRRSTRKAVVGDEGEKAIAIETPALAATTRRGAQASMVRRKVETQFEEEENGNGKKTVPPTPAPLGSTSRRKVNEEESTVKKLYSTRRSVRLAEKSVEMLKSNYDEKLETLKQELFTKEIGVDTKTMGRDNSEREVEDPKFSMEGSKNMENQLDLINEIQENDGSHNTCISEDIDSEVSPDVVVDENSSCHVDSEKETMDSEVSPDVVVDENSSCHVDSEKETKKEPKDKKYMDSEVFSDSLSELNVENGIHLVKEVEMEEEEADFEFIDQSTFLEHIDNGEELDSTETLQHEQNMQDDADQVSIASENSLGEVSSDDDNLDYIDDSTFPKQTRERIEILEFEQSKQESDQVAIESATTLIPTVDPCKEVQSTRLKTPKAMKKMPGVSDNKENIGSASKFLIFTKEVKTPSKTPTRNDVTDNKENLDSGKKMTLLTKEKVKKTKEQNLHEFSLRKLTKMFKEKLQITNQSSKNEHDQKAAEATATATAGPALQALPENQLVD